MTRQDVTDAIHEARRAQNLTFTEIADRLGVDRVWLTAALLGQHPLGEEHAAALCALLNLPDAAAAVLREPPVRGSYEALPPTDPTVYRLYEVLQVYGPALKALIHEDFGDGIMSAINFSLAVEKGEHDAGPRVRIVLDGKWLPYEWARSAGAAPGSR